MSTSPAGPCRSRRGKRAFAFSRTLQVESLETRLLLSGSSGPRPTGLAAAALISAPASPQPVLATIAVGPAGASLDCYSTQQFTAVGMDQFGNPLAVQPAFTWKASSGKITSAGLFTPAAQVGNVMITAASGSIRGGTVASVSNCPPTLPAGPSATLNPSTGKTAALSVLGADDGGQAKLRYTWSVTTHPPGAPAAKFSANGSNAAKNSTVTFGAAGSYVLGLTVTDALGLSTTGSVAVVVQPAVAKIAVSPAKVKMDLYATQQFTVAGWDQFGRPLAVQPTWTASLGTITAAGLYTPSATSGKVTITAAGGSIQGTATAAVFNTAPTVATAASATPGRLTSATAALAVLGTDDGGEANLSYTWSTAAQPRTAPAPTFSVNGANAAKNTTVTFGAVGSYAFTVTITDSQGLSTTSRLALTVAQGLASVQVSPATATVLEQATKKFTALGYDQFGVAMAPQPAFAWSAAAGTVTAGGLFTAPAAPGPVTVTAASGSVSGTAQATVTPLPDLGLQDPGLKDLTGSLFARDGQINRADMIQILESVGQEDGLVDAAELSDFRKIVSDAALLDMPGYVQTLAGDVVNPNPANADYQGQPLGNLAAGSPKAKLTKLVDKWFLGMDHPAVTWASYTYRTCKGSLFGAAGPQYTDVQQGQLGDCYFISALASIARVAPVDIQHMFIDNGDGTWTVRFYNDNGTPDYVTVDRLLPADSKGELAYCDCPNLVSNAKNILWIALAEKAYAQWNETGHDDRGDTDNSYASIESGWTGAVDAQVLGRAAATYANFSGWDGGFNEQVLISAIDANRAVSACTVGDPDSTTTKLVGDHCYNLIAYDSASGTFTLYNPWGPNYNYSWYPNSALICNLTWDQVNADLEGIAVADPSPAPPAIGSPLAADAALACFASLASGWQSPLCSRAAASPQPPPALKAALVDAVLHAA